ncbi:class I SAM-dependent methyltransferase [Sphingobium sp. 3R8]|uniref:class I SAM-dependent methyltransferase n=1 Tax=Sphingobium sp. 3R8 TaxID=2874921 RepID=UPI001CCD2F95|nr:methyltransferase domain-containing protein [Sphingobium sp. 3R8]MBZ9649637.1 class I SAM-dependent methyltransferase [Sphingobium sp. 3R8]
MMELDLNSIPSDFEGRRQHALNKIQDHIEPGAHAGRFLDIGCGSGNGVIAALQAGFKTAVGIDRSFTGFSWFIIEEFDKICKVYDIDAARSLMIEADIFKCKLQPKSFSCVMMLDSIEHVPNPKAFIDVAANYVAPGGYFLLDTCPLFYSNVGHHLFDDFGPEKFPWAHLRKDFTNLVEEHKVSSWSMQYFEELNKVTHAELIRYVVDAGLEIIKEHKQLPTQETMALLEENRDFLNLEGVDEATLFEDWILLVAQRPTDK